MSRVEQEAESLHALAVRMVEITSSAKDPPSAMCFKLALCEIIVELSVTILKQQTYFAILSVFGHEFAHQGARKHDAGNDASHCQG